LGETLRSLHVDTVVVTGLVTHGCVKATSIGAQEAGLDVILVQDGHSSFSKDAAKLIEEWNEKLSARHITVKPTSEIMFD